VAKVAAPPASEPAPKPAASPERSPAPVATKPAAKSAAAAPAGRYAVQVGAFGESDAAEKLAERLRGRGYSSYVLASTDGDSRWRVRVGPVPERATAEALATKLEKNEKLPTWVLDEGQG
jgi:cell division septation protein DedD